MRFMAFLALILLIAPASAVCEEEKAEYEKALADYNANPTEETNNALKAAYLRYTVCVSKNTVVEIEETVTATPTSNEIPPECREKYEEYMSAWNLYLEKGDPDYYFEARNKQYEYYSCLESHPASTAATPTTTSTPGPQEEVEKTPERIREPMRIHEKQNLVEISKPTDEVLDQKFVQLMEELERELENYSPSESDPEVMDRIVDAANRLVEREAEMEKIAASRDVETQNLVSEIVSSTPESEKSLVEELLYMALEKSKEKAVEATEAYLKEELKKRGYGKLVSKVEKFEEWNSKANDYLSKAVELKEFKEEIDGISKLHKDGQITEDDSKILKAAIALKKCISWITSKIPVIGDSMSEVYTKSLDAGIKAGVMFAKHKKSTNDIIDCLEANTC